MQNNPDINAISLKPAIAKEIEEERGHGDCKQGLTKVKHTRHHGWLRTADTSPMVCGATGMSAVGTGWNRRAGNAWLTVGLGGGGGCSSAER